jgi:putative flippase GtrA
MVARYIVFALISTFANLFLQFLSFKVYSGIGAIYLAMFVGTLSGLVIKYILDKKYIFFHEVKDKKEDAKKFALYSLMGVFTTLIFWGVEILFDHIYNTSNAKYIGGLIGLAIGYVIKYFLDKKFVFIDKEI